MVLRRSLSVGLALISGLLVTVALLSTRASARPAGRHAALAAAAIHSSDAGLQFTSRTVVIPSSVVHKDLVGVSAKGLFKFRSSQGALAKLKRGKVMFLQGSDAQQVVKVSHQHGQLLVSTKPASLPDLIEKGTLKFSGTPNFRNAFVAPLISSGKARDLVRPSYPYLGRPAGALARAAGGPTFSIQGSAGAFGYSLGFTPSNGRLDVSGTICFQWGGICSTGPSNGLSLEANLSGYVDIGSDSASIAMNGGRITNSTISLSRMHAHLKLTYTAARGTGPDSGGDPPVFHIPVGIDYTIPGEIPIYIKVQTAILVKLGMSSKNTVLRGGIEYDSTASDSIASSGSKVSGSGSGTDPKGSVLDSGDGGTGPTVALGAGGVVVAVQFPKLGVGLGVRSANAIGYLDMITSFGQTAAGSLSLVPGCMYDFDWSEGGGFELQAGPLLLATPRKILYPTDGKQFSFSTKSPSC